MDKKTHGNVKLLALDAGGFTCILGEEVVAAEIGELLRALRLAADIQQGELAESSGIRYQNLSRMEHGNRRATLETVNRIVRALGYELVLTARPRSKRKRRRRN